MSTQTHADADLNSEARDTLEHLTHATDTTRHNPVTTESSGVMEFDGKELIAVFSHHRDSWYTALDTRYLLLLENGEVIKTTPEGDACSHCNQNHLPRRDTHTAVMNSCCVHAMTAVTSVSLGDDNACPDCGAFRVWDETEYGDLEPTYVCAGCGADR